MIYTITLNPGLDYIVEMPDFKYGKTNRAVSERFRPGGKGLNVALVLKRLGEEAKAFGFIGGFSGQKLKRIMDESGVECDFVEVEGNETRINVKLVTDRVTELNGRGLSLQEKEKQILKERIEKLSEDDMLVLSGTLPKGADSSYYKELMSYAKCPAVLDTAGEALLSALPLRPFLIKPNEEEIAELSGIEDPSEEEIVACVRELQQKGARHVLVSRGKDSAVLVTEDGRVFKACPPDTGDRTAVYPIGAGDSLVAGFIHASRTFSDPEDWLRYSLACGTGSVVSEFLTDKETTEAFFNQMKQER